MTENEWIIVTNKTCAQMIISNIREMIPGEDYLVSDKELALMKSIADAILGRMWAIELEQSK